MIRGVQNKPALHTILASFLFFVAGGVSCQPNGQFWNSTAITEKYQLLEVQTDASETSYPSGKILEIRLYSNKEVEFDYYPPYTAQRNRTASRFERKMAMLTDEDFDEIKSILSKPDLVNAKDYYGPSRETGIDSSVRKTVTFGTDNQKKVIVLEERDSDLHLEEKSTTYPPSLTRLLQLVESINRNLRKRIEVESR